MNISFGEALFCKRECYQKKGMKTATRQEDNLYAKFIIVTEQDDTKHKNVVYMFIKKSILTYSVEYWQMSKEDKKTIKAVKWAEHQSCSASCTKHSHKMDRKDRYTNTNMMETRQLL